MNCAQCDDICGDDEDFLCEDCRSLVCNCASFPTWGVVPRTDIRYYGGYVDAQGRRHDPMRHSDACPTLGGVRIKCDKVLEDRRAIPRQT